MHSIVLIPTTTGTVEQWADTPTTVALIFGLAGAFYLGIYALRRQRGPAPAKGKSFDLVRLPI